MIEADKGRQGRRSVRETLGVGEVQRSALVARGRRAVLLAVLWCAVATVMVVLVGCQAGNGVDAPAVVPSVVASPGPALSTTGPVSRAEQAGQAALDAYRGMWRDFAEAGATSDWQSPLLGQHATGIALLNLSRGLYADSVNGLVTRGEPILSPEVASVEPPEDPVRVRITDCGDSAGWLKYREGEDEPVSDSPGGRRFISAVVDKQPDGSWKVSDYAVRELGTC